MASDTNTHSNGTSFMMLLSTKHALECSGCICWQNDSQVLMQDAEVAHIAKKNCKTVAQTLLRWGLQHGTSVIPKSSNPKHSQVKHHAPYVLNLSLIALYRMHSGSHVCCSIQWQCMYNFDWTSCSAPLGKHSAQTRPYCAVFLSPREHMYSLSCAKSASTFLALSHIFSICGAAYRIIKAHGDGHCQKRIMMPCLARNSS